MCLRGRHRKGVHVFTYMCTSMNISIFVYIYMSDIMRKGVEFVVTKLSALC